jgi:hypothetical protein
LFRDTLKKYRDQYRTASSRRSKREIILTAIEDFQKRGGRFLERVFLTTDVQDDNATRRMGKSFFKIVEGNPVFLKARQAFRYLLREREGPEKAECETSPPAMNARQSSVGSETEQASGATTSRQASPQNTIELSSAGDNCITRTEELDGGKTNLLATRSTNAGGLHDSRGAMAYWDSISTRILAEAARRDMRMVSAGSLFPTILSDVSVMPARTALYGPFARMHSYSDSLTSSAFLVRDEIVIDGCTIKTSRKDEFIILTGPPLRYLLASAEHNTNTWKDNEYNCQR